MRYPPSMRTRFLMLLMATSFAVPLTGFGQGVIGDRQHGLGPGGYLPEPVQPPFLAKRLSTSLTLPGFEFDLVTRGTNFVNLIIDPAGPVVVPLASGRAVRPVIPPEPLIPIIVQPGFWSTFTLANFTRAEREFTFPWQYWADNKILFRLYDTDETLLWQSVLLPVDVPPLISPVTATLRSWTSWRQTVFVPLNPGGPLLNTGLYRLEAALTGTPRFSASASFEVKRVAAGPIIDPVFNSGIRGKAVIGPIRPVEMEGVPNERPLPGAVIHVEEIRFPGVYYIRPPFYFLTTANHDGNYHFDLTPGPYLVTGLPLPRSIARGDSQTVVVTDGQYTNIVVHYDSGMR